MLPPIIPHWGTQVIDLLSGASAGKTDFVCMRSKQYLTAACMWALDLSGEPLLFVCSRAKSESPRLVLIVRGFHGAITGRVLRLVRVDGLGIVIRLSSVKAYFDSLIS